MARKEAASFRRQRSLLQVSRPVGLEGILLCRGSDVTHSYPRHWHEEFHFCAYTSGAGYVKHRGTSRLVAEGDFVVTPPGEVHENWVDGEAGISFCGAYIDAAAFRKASVSVTGRDHVLTDVREVLVDRDQLRRSFLAMYEAAERGASQLEQDASLLTFVHCFLSRSSPKLNSEQQAGSERVAVRKTRQYIEDNFSQSISLDALGALTDLSPFHLHRVFSAEVGMPPHAYQTQLRINRAKQLLRSGLPLSTVALSTGFADQSHLTRHFHRLVGLTPGQYQFRR